MDFFRSRGFIRTFVLLVASLLLHDSVDVHRETRDGGDSSVQVLVEAATEHGSDDWELRFFGTETNVCSAPAWDMDFASPFTLVAINFSNAVSLFKSVPTELPSPPPKG